MSFHKQVFWITGASSGIGKAIAIELSKQGSQLIISSRNEAALNAVKNECNSEKTIVLPLDLAQHDQMAENVKKALTYFGKIDVLINNGGISQRSLTKNTLLEVDKQIMAVNYFGTVALTKALLPYFIKQQKGHFVTITSIVGKIGTPLRSSYAASKHALHGFFDSLRAEIYEDNITVTLACPGFVQTNVSMNALTGDGSKLGKMDAATQNGLTPQQFAKQLFKAIKAKKQEVYIGGAKEILAVNVKRFFPKLLAKMIRKIEVT